MKLRNTVPWSDETWSPWWGCTKAGEECLHCYAEALDGRWNGVEVDDGAGGKVRKARHWGRGAPRRLLSDSHWAKLATWNAKAPLFNRPITVFPSMCDPFDPEAPADERVRFFEAIRHNRNLFFLVLTKRPDLVPSMLPKDWGQGYSNVALGVSVGVRRMRYRLDRLRQVPAVLRFASFEPLLEDLGELNLEGFGQAIVGGESGRKARVFHLDWGRRVLDQAGAQGVARYFKQCGARPLVSTEEALAEGARWRIRSARDGVAQLRLKDAKGENPAEWPKDLQGLREVPEVLRRLPPFTLEEAPRPRARRVEKPTPDVPLLPHMDCPACPACSTPAGEPTTGEDGATLECARCDHRWRGSPRDLTRATAARRAWDAQVPPPLCSRKELERQRLAREQQLAELSRVGNC